jgi:putative phosphoesterase
MLLGVVSDTHGHVPYTQAAVDMLLRHNVNVVAHCGDIGSPQIPALFAAWPTHFVLGNVDRDVARLAAAIEEAKLTFHQRFADFTLAGRRIALVHSDDFYAFRNAIASGDYDLVCYGHSHVAEQHREGRTLVLNPGALYRADPHSLAIVDLTTMAATIIDLT